MDIKIGDKEEAKKTAWIDAACFYAMG